MHAFLGSVGPFCARHHWWVVGLWLVVLVGLALARGQWGGLYSNDYTVPGSPSQQGTDVLQAQFPNQSAYAGQLVLAGSAPQSQEATVNQAVSTSLGTGGDVAARRPRVVAAALGRRDPAGN